MRWWLATMDDRAPFTVDVDDDGLVCAAGGGFSWLVGGPEASVLRHLRLSGAQVRQAGVRSADESEYKFPHGKFLPVPDDVTSRTMYTAHRLDNVSHAIQHADQRVTAADKARSDGQTRRYHLIHARHSLGVGLEDMKLLSDNLRAHYPAESAELDLVTAMQQPRRAKSLTPRTRTATTAHLTQTVLYQLTHAARHATTALAAKDGPQWEFEHKHLRSHVDGAQEHLAKLIDHVRDNYPDEWRHLQDLQGEVS